MATTNLPRNTVQSSQTTCGYKNGITQVSGKWKVRVMIAGRIYRRTFRTKASAKEFIDLLERRATGLSVPEIPLTINDLKREQERHMLVTSRSEATTAYYAKIWTRLESYWNPDSRISAIDQRVIDAYVEFRRAEGAGNAVIRKELSALGAAWRLHDAAISWKIPAFSVRRRRRRVPPDHEIATMYQSLVDRPQASRAFLLALLTGVRPSEVYRAHVSWIDRKEQTIHVRPSKVDHAYKTWLCHTLAEAIPETHSGPIVEISESALRSLLVRRSTSLGLPVKWSGLEGLRHACATWASHAGATDAQVDQLLGHVSGSIARRHYIDAENWPGRRIWLERVEERFLLALRHV